VTSSHFGRCEPLKPQKFLETSACCPICGPRHCAYLHFQLRMFKTRDEVIIRSRSVMVALTKTERPPVGAGAALESPKLDVSKEGSMSKLRHVKSCDNSAHGSEPHNSEPGWHRIVAGVAVGAASITTLAITGSMEHATAVGLLVMFPFRENARD
jgi:hypothetical protein